jgi:hypothetical protein
MSLIACIPALRTCGGLGKGLPRFDWKNKAIPFYGTESARFLW